MKQLVLFTHRLTSISRKYFVVLCCWKLQSLLPFIEKKKIVCTIYIYCSFVFLLFFFCLSSMWWETRSRQSISVECCGNACLDNLIVNRNCFLTPNNGNVLLVGTWQKKWKCSGNELHAAMSSHCSLNEPHGDIIFFLVAVVITVHIGNRKKQTFAVIALKTTRLLLSVYQQMPTQESDYYISLNFVCRMLWKVCL